MHTSRPVITGNRGIITSGHYLATAAGLQMFAKGGNAVDAAVSAGFALAVLKPQDNSLGGECPILIYSPKDRRVVAISGQGVAPRKATIRWFKENKIKMIPGDGLLAATVPGMLGSYCTALMKFGFLTLKDVLEPAIELAAKGFPLYNNLRNCISGNEVKFKYEWPSTGEVFIPGGKIPKLGEVLKQSQLAETLKSFVEVEDAYRTEGREKAIERVVEFFYKGEIAEKILRYAKGNPVKDATDEFHTTLLEQEDFNGYRTKIEEPVFADYRKYRVFKCGPWTQGPVFLQQLKLLEGFDLNKMGHNSSEYIHVVVECAKRAFADRERYYGDPDFSDVPLGRLLSKEYNDEMREKIGLKKANNSFLWESGEVGGKNTYEGDTTHLDAVDSGGLMMSATPSGGWIPSSPVIPDVGFPLGTRAQVFNLKEGHPNCLQPGKRPRTTLTPSMAFKDGTPCMAFGTPGGDMQDQWTLQFFLNATDFGMNLQEAIDAVAFDISHFPSSFYPHDVGIGVVSIEEGVDSATISKLKEMGHNVIIQPSNSKGQVCAVRVNDDTGFLEGAASAKNDGQAYASGW